MPKKGFTVFFILLTFIFADSSPAQDKETWMEIYSGDEKVGFTFRGYNQSGSKINIKEKTSINLNVLGLQTEMVIEAEYESVDFRPSSFDYKVTSDSIGLNLTGKVNENILTLKDRDSGSAKEYVLEQDYIVPSLLPEYIFKKGLENGKKYSVYLFDPVNIYTGYSPDALLSKIEVMGVESVETKAGKFEANRVSVKFLGARSFIWITPEGREVKEEFEPSLTAYLSTKKASLGKKSKPFDIAEKTSIPSDRYIHNPRNIKRMVVAIKGIEGVEGLDIYDGYSQFDKDGAVEIRPPDLKDIAPENGGKKLIGSDTLSSTPLIQSDDPLIKEQTEKIVNNEKNSLNSVKLINRWVYDNIEKVPTVSIPNAVEVLKVKKGDCNEHAVLFAAMARSAGIPTKVVLGVIYLEGRFYYHAWNEVYVGSWVPLDSTYGQFPADATHIKILEGDIAKSPEILGVVGKMKLNVIAAE